MLVVYEVSIAEKTQNLTSAYKDISRNDYLYDDFGNMTQNHNKNINQITYNHLNLPKKISFQNNNYIEYTYDASGVKLKKKVTENNTISVTDYLDGFQYNNSKLQFFPHAEGYVKHTLVGDNNDISIFKYVYQYKDHLGNVRVNYTLENGSLVILDEQHYYPFGLEHGAYNPTRKEYRKAEDGGNNDIVVITEVENSGYQYKYNGKELQDELGLDVYDYGARFYYPDAPHFWQIDPKADEFPSQSPYVYAANNPVYFIDKNGMAPSDEWITFSTGETVKVGNKGGDTTDYVHTVNESGEITTETLDVTTLSTPANMLDGEDFDLAGPGYRNNITEPALASGAAEAGSVLDVIPILADALINIVGEATGVNSTAILVVSIVVNPKKGAKKLAKNRKQLNKTRKQLNKTRKQINKSKSKSQAASDQFEGLTGAQDNAKSAVKGQKQHNIYSNKKSKQNDKHQHNRIDINNLDDL